MSPKEPIEKEFNFRERISVYAGRILGIMAPIIATRYFFDMPQMSDNPVSQEALSWGISALGNIVLTGITLPFKGFPLVYFGHLGATLGYLTAENLRDRRLASKSKDITDVFVATPDDIID